MALTISESEKQLTTSVAYLLAENDYLNTPRIILIPLQEDLVEWLIQKPLYDDINRKTQEITANFRVLRVKTISDLSAMKQYFRHSGLELRPDDYSNLFINKLKKRRQIIPVPNILIKLKIISRKRAELKMQATRVESPTLSGGRLLNSDIKYITIYIVLKSANDFREPAPEEYIVSQRFSSSIFLLKFKERDIQKTAWIQFTVSNPRGKEGKRGTPIKVIVPD